MARNRLSGKLNNQGITITVAVVVMLLSFFTSCGGDKKEIIAVSFDPETSYTLRTTDVSTLISDSGITRYRLKAQDWMIFDKAKEPFWYFPEGLYLEKFDSLFQAEAYIEADTAYNFEKKGLWKLIGNVKIENLEGKKFETSLLYLDQKEEKMYSDQFIRITEADNKVITGIGFESSQDMSHYQIFNSAGQFPVSDSPPAAHPADTTMILSESDTLDIITE